jgi:hypothetical protein
MRDKDTLLRGEKENPYHLSIGQVVMDDNSKIALIKKKDGTITLPRETTYLNENYEEALVRGATEELGVIVVPIKFIGSLITEFNREPETVLEKSTLYFLCKVSGTTEQHLEEDELDDTVLWVDSKEAIHMLKGEDNPEAQIVTRTLGEI